MGKGNKLLKSLNKGNKKAFKWKKGQSCVSNAAITKHRDLARQGFFQKIDNSALTEDALSKHTEEARSAPQGSASSVRSRISNYPSQLLNIVTKLSAGDGAPSVKSSGTVNINFAAPKSEKSASKHTMDLQKDMENMAIDEQDDLKSQAKTFASRYTTCSLPAFEKFFNSMSIESEHQKKMLAFHATVQELIKKMNLPESPSSYFVAIITSVDGLMSDPEEVSAGLALLVRVIKAVPLHVLRAKCQEFGDILNNCLKTYQDSNNTLLLTNALGSLSILVRAQHLASWCKDDQLRTWFKNILVFTMHSNPKVRKSGQYNVSAVLKGSAFMITSNLRNNKGEVDDDDDMESNEGEDMDSEEAAKPAQKDVESGDILEIHPASDLVGDFLIGQLKSSGNLKAANKATLHMLVFARQVIMTMPKSKLQYILHCLFGLVDLGNGLVNSTVLQALQTLCEASPPIDVLPLSLNTNILNTLTKHTPGMSSALIAAPHDFQAVKAWSSAITPAIQNTIRLDIAVGLQWAGNWCRTAMQYWRTDDTRVLSQMESSVSSVLATCYDNINLNNSQDHTDAVRAIVMELEAALSYQYQGAWPCVFRLLGQCYQEFGLYYAPIMMPSLKSLCELMSSTDLASGRDLEKAIGKAVQGLGVGAVFGTAPVTITGNIVEDQKNFWVLPLLRKYVRGSRLLYFNDHFIPLAEKCTELLSQLKGSKKPNPQLIQVYSTVEYQIWALLPSFAAEAVDVEDAQKNKFFARKICLLIELSNECRLVAMRALRNMVHADGSSTGRLALNSNKYLPALFNVFAKESKNARNADKPNTVDGSHRKAAFETIKVYLSIVPAKTTESFMKNIIGRYNDEKENKQHHKNYILNLARLFVPHVSAEQVHGLINIITPLIKSAKDRRQQKAAYKMLQDILDCESVSATEYINNHLPELTRLQVGSSHKTINSSHAPRLRCAKVVLGKVSAESKGVGRDDFIISVVEEAVECIGRTCSTAARLAANDVLRELSPAMCRIHNNDQDIAIRECMRLMSGGLMGRSTLCANTVYAITVFTYHNKEMPFDIVEQNVDNMCLLLGVQCREVVQSCLSFVKGIVHIYPTVTLGPLVKTIMAGIVSMVTDCAKKYRIKIDSILTRLIEKFGADHVSRFVPQQEEVLHKKLRNLRKKFSRDKRRKDEEDGEESEEDRVGGGGGDELCSEKLPTTLEEILAAIDPDQEDDDDKKLDWTEKQRRRNKPAAAWIEENDSEDDILDLLGPAAAQAIRSAKPKTPRMPKEGSAKDAEEDEGFSIDPVSGKLIITEDKKADKAEKKQITMKDMDDVLQLRAEAMTGKISKRKRAHEEVSDDEDSDAGRTVASSKMSKRSTKKNKFDYGSEYRSKKGYGDSMKKGQTQKPFAYVPLDKERLNKRKKAKYEGQFKAVVRGAKRGAQMRNKKK